MVCNQCGAEYKKDLLQCPYCHSENKKEAKRQKRRILESYDREAAEIKREVEKYSEKAANKATKYLVLGVCAILALGVLLIILYLLCSKILFKMEYAGEEANIAKLESYFGAGDYESLCAYMDEKNLYDRDYDKYGEIWDVYDCLRDMDEARAQIATINGYTFSKEEKWQSAEFWLGMYVESAGKVLSFSKEYSEDRVFRGNEEALLQLKEEALKELEEVGFTREEIDRLYTEEADALTDLKERLFEMLFP